MFTDRAREPCICLGGGVNKDDRFSVLSIAMHGGNSLLGAFEALRVFFLSGVCADISHMCASDHNWACYQSLNDINIATSCVYGIAFENPYIVNNETQHWCWSLKPSFTSEISPHQFMADSVQAQKYLEAYYRVLGRKNVYPSTKVYLTIYAVCCGMPKHYVARAKRALLFP